VLVVGPLRPVQAKTTPSPPGSSDVFAGGQNGDPGMTLPVLFADENEKTVGSHFRRMLKPEYATNPLPAVLIGTLTLPATSDGAPTTICGPMPLALACGIARRLINTASAARQPPAIVSSRFTGSSRARLKDVRTAKNGTRL
jgi:hypothetical protein